MKVGVLALQGDFEAHSRQLTTLGADCVEVRTPEGLDDLDALVIPGGESTTITLGVEREGLAEPIQKFAHSNRPIFGTCAGLIMLDRNHLGLMDIKAERNAFGRQMHSFEQDLAVKGVEGAPLRAIFIRAPWVAEQGPAVETLGVVDEHVVAVREWNLLAVAFHPEMTDDLRMHQLFLKMI